ncbi:hypothetical protein HDU91_001100, partial [Kappamyces sp. JEL0680]
MSKSNAVSEPILYYKCECSILLQDMTLQDTRVLSLTDTSMVIQSKASAKDVLTIPLRNIVNVLKFSRQHPARFVGGLPHVSIDYLEA